MIDNFKKSLALVLESEGVWSDHPEDPGGATMKGVTIAVFSQFIGHAATKGELHAITDEQLQAIYKRNYWDQVRGDDLPLPIDYMAFDFGVNAGNNRAAKTLQKAVGLPPDGIIGPVTLAAVKAADARKLADDFSQAKCDFYKQLRNFPTFGRGWLSRVAKVHDSAIALLAGVESTAGNA